MTEERERPERGQRPDDTGERRGPNPDAPGQHGERDEHDRPARTPGRPDGLPPPDEDETVEESTETEDEPTP